MIQYNKTKWNKMKDTMNISFTARMLLLRVHGNTTVGFTDTKFCME